MPLEFTYNKGRLHFSYTRHLLGAVGSFFICAGLAALFEPWWQPILLAALNKADSSINVGTNYVIALILIFIGIGIFLFKHFGIDKWSRQLASDKEMLTVHLPNTELAQNYLRNLADDHSYLSSQDDNFQHAFHFFNQPQTAFQYKPTSKLYMDFSKRAKSLHCFVGTNFFIFPENQHNSTDYRYCMAPQLNDDRGMVSYDPEKARRYDDMSKELLKRVEEVKKSYSTFLKHLRKVGTLK